MKRSAVCSATVLTALTVSAVGICAGADWPQFLGPKGENVSADKGLPTTWSATSGVVWKTAMPGFGASCPTILGDKIFLTAYSGYGLDKDKPGEDAKLERHLLCIDRATGKILWDKSKKAELPEQAYSGFLALHGYASSTVATDGKALYIFYGRSGVYSYSLTGDELWRAEVGKKTHGWGSSNSPLLAGDLVIINASVESESVVALNKATGKEAWRVDGIKQSWSTPALLQLPDGKQEVVVSLHSKVLGLEPATGKELWNCAGVPDYTCPAVLTHGDVAYVTGGRKVVTMAIRGGGRGDVNKSHKLWEISIGSKVPTPVYNDGLLYWLNDQGIACCVKADSGKEVYKERLSNLGVVYSSMLLADGKLYSVSREKGAIVLALGPELKELARNDLGDASIFNATPVPSDGRLLLRSDKFLYCIGK
jgi:outer membrane protein assembly factor BamB